MYAVSYTHLPTIMRHNTFFEADVYYYIYYSKESEQSKESKESKESEQSEQSRQSKQSKNVCLVFTREYTLQIDIV